MLFLVKLTIDFLIIIVYNDYKLTGWLEKSDN